MADFDIDVAEIRRFERDVEVGAQESVQEARDTVRWATFETESRGKTKAAVDTGFMRNSITSDFRGSNADVAQGETGPDAEYAKWVEHGTSRQPPQPFMGPAGDEVEPAFYERLERIDPLGTGA